MPFFHSNVLSKHKKALKLSFVHSNQIQLPRNQKKPHKLTFWSKKTKKKLNVTKHMTNIGFKFKKVVSKNKKFYSLESFR